MLDVSSFLRCPWMAMHEFVMIESSSCIAQRSLFSHSKHVANQGRHLIVPEKGDCRQAFYHFRVSSVAVEHSAANIHLITASIVEAALEPSIVAAELADCVLIVSQLLTEVERLERPKAASK